MKSVNLEVIENKCNYNQSSQTASIEFSLLKRVDKDSFKELHYQVRCREYFGDTLASSVFDVDMPTIYGFRFRGKRQTLDETIMSVSIPNSAPSENKNFEGFLKKWKILHELEGYMKVPVKRRSKLFLTGEVLQGAEKLVVVSPVEWQYSPLLISLYTLVLRIATYDIIGSVKKFTDYFDYFKMARGNDADMLSDISILDIELLLRNYKKVFGDAPITGLDDQKVRDGWRDDDEDANTHFTYDLSKYGGSHIESGSYSTSSNHCYHGIHSFSYCIGNDHSRNSNRVGYKWVINYLNLLIEQDSQIEK